MSPYFALISLTVLVGGHNIDNKGIFDPNLYLVRAKAVTVSYEGGRARCVFLIEHVYLGADSLKGEHFEIHKDGFLYGMDFFCWTNPKITKDEVSIWWVADCPVGKKNPSSGEQLKKKYRLVSAEDNPATAWHVPFHPGRKGIDEDYWGDKWYKKIEKYAQAMERVYRARGAERLDLLKEFCRRDERVLQEWSLDRLKLALAETEYVAFLTRLSSNSPLSLWMEHVVDGELSKLSPGWPCSETRMKFFQRWVNGKLSDGRVEDDENFIEYSLVRTNFDGFPSPTFFRLMIDGLTTDRRSQEFKKQLLHVRCFPKQLASVDAGFAYLMSQIREAAPDRRLAATRLLLHFVPLCKAQEIDVQKLLEDPASRPITSHLAAVIQQTAVVLDGLSGNDGPKVDSARGKMFQWILLLWVSPEPQTARFIREHVRPAIAVDPARVQKIAEDLDHEAFRRREAASGDLARMGLEAEPILRHLLSRASSVESRNRLNDLLSQFKKERIVTLRSIEILAKISIPEARELLQKLAGGAPQSQITREARKALEAKDKTAPTRSDVQSP